MDRSFFNQLKDYGSFIALAFGLYASFVAFTKEDIELQTRVKILEENYAKYEVYQNQSTDKILATLQSMNVTVRELSDKFIMLETKINTERELRK